MEKIFIKNLKKKLAKKIKCDAKIYIINDDLYIELWKDNTPLYRTYVEHFYYSIHTGLTSDDVAHMVSKTFKKYLLNKYFSK